MHISGIQGVIGASIIVLASGQSFAATVDWIDWTTATGLTSVSGEFGGASTGITANYAGLAAFVRLTPSTNSWIPSAPYTSPTVENPPPTSDLIALSAATGSNLLTFSEPVTNPVMAIASLGQPNVQTMWDFDAPFTILSVGAGAFGNGPLTQLPGDVLAGNEGHGAIQFLGTFSTISWNVSNGESWTGFTIGLIPSPGAFGLAMTACVVGIARRRR